MRGCRVMRSPTRNHDPRQSFPHLKFRPTQLVLIRRQDQHFFDRKDRLIKSNNLEKQAPISSSAPDLHNGMTCDPVAIIAFHQFRHFGVATIHR